MSGGVHFQRQLLAGAVGLSAVIGVAVSLPGPADAAKVGVAAAVNPDAFSGGKQIKIGKSIFYNERIRTDANGVVQVLLVDGSTFTVGANSNVVIDRFVYDPKKKTGEIVTSFSKGSLRYVGGKISKNPGGVTINTPDGSLAVRGGMVQGTVGGGKSIFSFLFGEEMIYTGSNGKTYKVYQPGYTLDLSTYPPSVRRTTAADVNIVMASLSNSNTSTDGGSGDSSPPPQQNIDTAGLQQLISDATRTQIGDDILKQLLALQNLKVKDTSGAAETVIRSSIGGYGGGLSNTNYGYEYDIGVSNSPDDFSYNDQTGDVTLKLRGVDQTGTVGSGTLNFSPVSQTSWDLSSINLYRPDGSPILAGTSMGFLNAETQPICTNCDFIRWGSFSADYSYFPYGVEDPFEEYESIFGWWAGGLVTKFADLPTTGTASYSGNAVGSFVVNSGPQAPIYTGRGTLGMTWDFAKRSGGFSISNFRNPSVNLPDLNVGGTMTMPGQFNKFSGGLGGKVGNQAVTGAANGSFVTDGKRPAAGVVGNWNVSGGNYQATGVFGGVSKP